MTGPKKHTMLSDWRTNRVNNPKSKTFIHKLMHDVHVGNFQC